MPKLKYTTYNNKRYVSADEYFRLITTAGTKRLDAPRQMLKGVTYRKKTYWVRYTSLFRWRLKQSRAIRPYKKIKGSNVVRNKDKVEFMVVGRFNPILRHDPKCGKYHLKDLNIPSEHVWVSYYKLRKYYV